MQIRQSLKFIAAGTALATTSVLFLGVSPAGAVDQPVTFEVAAGTLSIAQTPTAPVALIEGSPVAMPVTTVTDGRNAFDRSGAWTVSAASSDLDEPLGGQIAATQITLDTATGNFFNGTGTIAPASVDGFGVLLEATNDTINSSFIYTPTAEMRALTNPNSGVYSGTVTQTVV